MTQAICDITTDEVNVDVVVAPQADTMVAIANRSGGMEQVFHDETLIGNGNSIDLGVNTDIIATKEYSDSKAEEVRSELNTKLAQTNTNVSNNAAAIAKNRKDFMAADQSIRADMNAEDSRLQSQITAHTTAISTNKNEIARLDREKIDKDQGKVNIGKVLTVGPDGKVVPKVPQGGGGSGIGVVAHDDTLIGTGTDEYPLGVKDKVTITIVEH